MKNELEEKLISYVEAERPIIYINTFDFNNFDKILIDVTKNEKAQMYEFNEGLGCVDFNTKNRIDGMLTNAEEFLQFVLELSSKNQNYIILKDFHENLQDKKIISLLKSIALKSMYNENFNTTILIVSTKLSIPIELEKLITVLDVPLPNQEECLEIIKNFVNMQGINTSESVLSKLSIYLKGFSEFEIEQVLSLAFQQSGSLDESDIDFILAEKEQIVKKTGMLKIMNFKDEMENIGGLENLKSWVKDKSKIFNQLDEAIKYGVAIPRGVLIVGMPGCGKSLTAKAISNLFKMPLLQLDVGKLLGKYVGESEENMRRTLQIAEAISPTVLWIDELEKAFAGIGDTGGHEVTLRLFGYFLTWMQEKSNSVFVVATSNDVSKLPPEFLRKGRFDEIFFVDFPNEKERKDIFKLHLEKRKKYNSADIDLSILAKKTEKYTGADIESLILAVIEKSFLNDKKKITTDEILNEIKTTKPMAVALKDKIEKLNKALQHLDIKSASKA